MQEFEHSFEYLFWAIDTTRSDIALEYSIMKVTPVKWDEYNFEKALKHLKTYGLRGNEPSLHSDWMKVIINTQIFGGCGTIDDMLSYAGYNVDRIKISRKYSFTNFLQYYHIIEEVKRCRKGGRVFEITKFGEDLIDYAAKH